jgi:hypothetical protein
MTPDVSVGGDDPKLLPFVLRYLRTNGSVSLQTAFETITVQAAAVNRLYAEAHLFGQDLHPADGAASIFRAHLPWGRAPDENFVVHPQPHSQDRFLQFAGCHDPVGAVISAETGSDLKNEIISFFARRRP